LPRFLLRLPYGKKSDPTERFKFEELVGKKSHEGYLWGNPALAAVCLLGQSFSEHGWAFRPGVLSEVDGVPVHVYEEDGEQAIKPCAEVLLTERGAEVFARKGLMPLLSVRGQDVVRLGAFRSLANPANPLAGPWRA
jgi:type VI secretion system protein ImpC